MNYLITKASNQGEWFNIDYCILKIDDKLKGRIKKYIDFIESIKDIDIKRSIRFHLYNFCEFDFFEYNEEMTLPIIDKWSQSDNVGYKEIALPEDYDKFLDIGEVYKREAYTMVLTSDFFYLRCYVKYGDNEEIYSVEIPVSVLR